MMLAGCSMALKVFCIAFLLTQTLANYFGIDFPNNSFVKDGAPFRYISGSIHYFRVPKSYWRDRLLKMRAAGLNAIQTYVPWNVHEPRPGQFDWEQEADIESFLKLAQELGFVVVLRAGPYICAEWENGGFPWWLLKDPNIKLRTADPRFLAKVKKYYAVLLPKLRPFLYKNGGPIILIQIENEYGSRPMCDIVYRAFLRDLFHSYFGYDTQLMTVDGGALSYLECGFIPGVYPSVDFGCGSQKGVAKSFQAQRTYAPRGPLVNTEFYPGWLDHWGSNFSRVAIQPILQTMTDMWNMNASFNFYMFEGGTNFGYMTYCTTSYDYDAPLSEAGDPTPKFYAIREHIQTLTGWPLPAHVPPATKKTAYGLVKMSRLGSVLDVIATISPAQKRLQTQYPLSMEDIDFPYGFIMYETVIASGGNLSVPGIRDRGYVMVDGKMQGLLMDKPTKKYHLAIEGQIGNKLQIFVENMGRTATGYGERKGIISNVTLNKLTLTQWTLYPILLENIHLSKIRFPKRANDVTKIKSANYAPSIYIGQFSASEVTDTYMDPSGWGKGQFFLNGRNVGRYWPSLGPQVTLYTPKTLLQARNQLFLLELDQPGNCLDQQRLFCRIHFTDRPFLNQTVPKPPPAQLPSPFSKVNF